MWKVLFLLGFRVDNKVFVSARNRIEVFSNGLDALNECLNIATCHLHFRATHTRIYKHNYTLTIIIEANFAGYSGNNHTRARGRIFLLMGVVCN